MAKDYSSVINKISGNSLKPVYFLHGSEPYFINKFVDKILEVTIPDFEKGFNEYILFGKDISSNDVMGNARKFPMMADRQLVVIKEAQQMSDIGTKDAQERLEKYAKNPLESTILVLAFDAEMDERKAWVKAFAEKGELLKFASFYDSEIPNFIMETCRNEGLKISPKAVQLLNDHIGNNLSAIVNEIQKIKINQKDSQEIDANTIQEYVGISKEYNIYELQKALTSRSYSKCLQIFQYFSKNEKDNPFIVNLATLYGYFSKILQVHAFKGAPGVEIASVLKVNPYFVKDYEKAASVFPVSQLMKIIRALNVADQKSKGIGRGNASDLDLYKDLLFSILR
jgi:DNA polymerase III subunit delta